MSRKYLALGKGQTVTFAGATDTQRGDKLVLNGKSYRVRMVLSDTAVAIAERSGSGSRTHLLAWCTDEGRRRARAGYPHRGGVDDRARLLVRSMIGGLVVLGAFILIIVFCVLRET